jgi:hypothetical protein
VANLINKEEMPRWNSLLGVAYFKVASIQIYISTRLLDYAEHICITEKPQMVCEHNITITQPRGHKPQMDQGFRVSHSQLQQCNEETKRSHESHKRAG